MSLPAHTAPRPLTRSRVLHPGCPPRRLPRVRLIVIIVIVIITFFRMSEIRNAQCARCSCASRCDDADLLFGSRIVKYVCSPESEGAEYALPH
eukprot:2588979-Rhodomonas_salina.1